ncbi:hypothetical protein NC653_001627 [Populus alba x Populus x berolinensis]|uniref:Uncharacterized protein n=1 Tax=Populus alba x Populus x berolinensis TaxID=444605 RepID=A0AAD6WFR9_9ROSI|nr:hypothetical protein NC653_001627 [Populus alba x Populus x berolinensis]
MSHSPISLTKSLCDDIACCKLKDDLELNKGLKKRSDILDMMQKKCSEPVLADLVDSEKMTESRFIIPQDIPSPN